MMRRLDDTLIAGSLSPEAGPARNWYRQPRPVPESATNPLQSDGIWAHSATRRSPANPCLTKDSHHRVEIVVSSVRFRVSALLSVPCRSRTVEAERVGRGYEVGHGSRGHWRMPDRPSGRDVDLVNELVWIAIG